MAKIPNFGDPLAAPPPKGETVSGTDMYHYAEFHADWCHRRRDICNWTRVSQTHDPAVISFYALSACDGRGL